MGTARHRYLLALDLFTAEANAAADNLGLQSACAGWTVADVVLHVIAVQGEHAGAALLGKAEFGQPGREHSELRADLPDLEAVAAWNELAARLRAAAAAADEGAFSMLPLATIDMAIHAWDVRRATVLVGLETNLEFPEPLLDAIDEYRAIANEGVIRKPGVFDPAVEPPGNATRSELLVAWTGRTVR